MFNLKMALEFKNIPKFLEFYWNSTNSYQCITCIIAVLNKIIFQKTYNKIFKRVIMCMLIIYIMKSCCYTYYTFFANWSNIFLRNENSYV